jgi:hypothetical protein
METSYALPFTIQGQNMPDDCFSIDLHYFHNSFSNKLLRSDMNALPVYNAKKSEIACFHREKIYRFDQWFLTDIQPR